MAKKKTAQSKATESAQSIWLAGLGALATAESEGGKLFKALVDRGKEYEGEWSRGVSRARKKVRREAERARAKAETFWGKVESGVDEAVASALQGLGVPSRKEIGDLSRRVDQLTRTLEKMSGEPKARATKKSTKKKAAKKSAKKKVVRKKKTTRTRA